MMPQKSGPYASDVFNTSVNRSNTELEPKMHTTQTNSGNWENFS